MWTVCGQMLATCKWLCLAGGSWTTAAYVADTLSGAPAACQTPRPAGPPVDFELLQLLSNLEDQIKALVSLIGGKRQHLILHAMMLHVLQQ